MLIFLLASVLSQWTSLPCTMHDYEGPLQSNQRLYDNSAPWCGQRYSILNVARIVALPNMNPGLCNQCVEIQGEQSVYVWVVDQREAYGLDIAGSSYQALFPNDNVLNPQTCRYRVVEASLCGRICYGTDEECTRGVRNNLPGYLLPEMGLAPIGLGSGSHRNRGDAESSSLESANSQHSSTTTTHNNQQHNNQQHNNQQHNNQHHHANSDGRNHANRHGGHSTTTSTTSSTSHSTTEVVGSSPESFGSALGQGVLSSAQKSTMTIYFVFLIATLFY